MRRVFLIFSLLVLCLIYESSFVYSQDLIEIDLIKSQLKFVDFSFGGCKINGEFIFAADEEDSSLIIDVAGSNITFADKSISYLRARLNSRGEIIFIPYIYLPQFIAKGEINLAKNDLKFNLEGSWEESSAFLEGNVKIKVKAWGEISNFLTSGYLVVDGGKYKGKEFLYLRIDFLGKLPVLNITDSQLILENGNVLEIKGVLDLRDFSNILPGAEYSPQRVFLDKWQLFSGDNQSVSLRKQLDDKFDVLLNTDGGQEGFGPQTEIRYSLKDNKFLKLKMEEEGTSLRFERRRDF